MHDPRDAALATAWAGQLQQVYWPGWLMPRKKPQGRTRWIWLVHLAWIATVGVIAIVSVLPSIPSPWRWVVLGMIVYGLVTLPITFVPILRAYWNAPEAERKNRELTSR